ncbi:MAG TPA: sirohydrochlorin chelatase [Candidatus Lambdaproteobacteria bacterium]|nr:sirohydrochlorin chelatase [SAR324 cluster bacterium]HIB44953.1 sirohydrochlorin chelatase [Candidatus Lambdaproteobacteria bacterium]HIN48147.1 sirohydrochlorin chelatase [Deltaproteobacteria bacterium]HIO11649.1 sirohydrochlorin chelatase [Deltaproteobacteria bacterium]
MEEKYGVMVCGHGSRDEEAVKEFQAVAQGLKERLPQYETDWGFLEFATPVISKGLDALRAKGIRKVLAVPGMLFAAGHVKNDIPSVLNAYQVQNPELSISYARELGIDLKIIRAAGERVEEALQKAGDRISREKTLLVVVGRGASDPDANSNVSKITRMIWEGLGLGWAETAYSGVTFPLVEPGLEHAARLGYKRIVVFPYFLFTGILVKRIFHYTDIVAAKHPEIEFVKASYLNDHPLVLDTFAERVEEIRNGANNMNCQLCKYREQFLGFENEVGLRQESHHHHVEGIGTGSSGAAERSSANGSSAVADDAHSHDHAHSHSHDHVHDHEHYPYPHADHPLGPKTLEENSGKSGAE